MQVSIFWEFGFKMLIHAPLGGFLGRGFDWKCKMLSWKLQNALTLQKHIV